jgi:hypothetical protein
MKQINGVGEYTETCEYEANKINVCLDLLRSEFKKVANRAQPNNKVHTQRMHRKYLFNF